VGFLDLFRGSRDERIARQYIKALREAGERDALTLGEISRELLGVT
jgi:hypothetical protein